MGLGRQSGTPGVVHRVDILPCRTLHEVTEETDQSSEDVSDSGSDDSLYVLDNIPEKTGVPDTCVASAKDQVVLRNYAVVKDPQLVNMAINTGCRVLFCNKAS